MINAETALRISTDAHNSMIEGYMSQYDADIRSAAGAGRTSTVVHIPELHEKELIDQLNGYGYRVIISDDKTVIDWTTIWTPEPKFTWIEGEEPELDSEPGSDWNINSRNPHGTDL